MFVSISEQVPSVLNILRNDLVPASGVVSGNAGGMPASQPEHIMYCSSAGWACGKNSTDHKAQPRPSSAPKGPLLWAVLLVWPPQPPRCDTCPGTQNQVPLSFIACHGQKFKLTFLSTAEGSVANSCPSPATQPDFDAHSLSLCYMSTHTYIQPKEKGTK